MTLGYTKTADELPEIANDFHVYLMRRKSDNAVKIGYSRDPSSRRSNIERTAGCEIKLISSTVIGTRGQATDLESFLHESLRPRNIKGEWFHLEDDETEALAWSMHDKQIRSRVLIEIRSRPFVGKSMCSW